MPEADDYSIFTPGKLEKSIGLDGKEIIPNPLPEIDQDAREQLVAWGLSDRSLRQLQELVRVFRYDLVPEKMRRLASQPVYVEWVGQTLMVYIPDYYDSNGEQKAGQCQDIAKNILIELHNSPLYQQIAKEVADQGLRLEVGYAYGTSPTHFIVGEASHVWNVLSVRKPGGEATTDASVVLDASFQKISLGQGYNEKGRIVDPQSIEMMTMAPFIARNLKREGENYKIDTFENINVLGRSTEGKWIYSLVFCLYEDEGGASLVPVLVTTSSDGITRHMFLNPENPEQLMGNHPQQDQSLIAEVKTILKEAQKIQLLPADQMPNEKLTKVRQPLIKYTEANRTKFYEK